MCKTAVVMTSINAYNEVMKSISHGCKEAGWEFIVVGDTLTPNIKEPGVTFLSAAKQIENLSSYAKLAPFRNYCRKNVGYLHAIKNGAKRIIETDDDNFPKDSFFKPHDKYVKTKLISQKGWVNAYRYFTDNKDIWPRGFSLSDVKNTLTTYADLEEGELYCPVQNGLVDNDPDIDALYRILFDIPFNFEYKDRAVAYNRGSWCSFNTQNTVFYEEMFPLMYQPATPKFREADILRSLVIQRILWENDAHTLFYSPTVWQERNEHDLMDDLKQETRLYAYIKDIARDLELLDIEPSIKKFHENMIKCYKVFQSYSLVDGSELVLLDAWFSDLLR